VDQVRPVKIFKLNDYEWWAGFTLEETIQAAMKECMLTREEVADNPRELTEMDLNRLIFTDCEEKDDEGEYKTRTFRQQLNREIVNGQKFPCIFASTEY